MLLHGFVPASRANGPGLRAVVYFQGCSLNCAGCWNRSSHKFHGPGISTGSVAEKVHSAIHRSNLEGVTFSGGEPMQQAPALVDLMDRIRALAPTVSMGMFTGYTPAELDVGRYATRQSTSSMDKQQLWQLVKGYLDFAIMGRYDRTQPGTAPLRTSANQELVLFTKRYEERDFGEQFAEVAIDAFGNAIITGFPIMGSPAI